MYIDLFLLLTITINIYGVFVLGVTRVEIMAEIFPV